MLRQVSRSTWLPLGVLPVAIPAVLVAVVAAAQGFARLSWPHLLWHSTSQVMHEHLLLAAPVAAAGATYFASRVSARGRITSQPYAARAGNDVLLRSLLVLCVVFVGAYTTGLAPLIVLTIMRAENSGPGVLPVATGLLGMVVAVMAGYAIGILLSSTWAWPLVLVGTFVALALPAEDPRLIAISPVTSWELGLQWTETTAFQLYRIAFMVLICILAVRVGSRALSRAKRWHRPSGPTFLIALVAGTFVVLPFQLDLTRIEWSEPSAAECERHDTVTYCVHPARASQLPSMRSGIDNVLAWTGTPGDGALEVLDAALATADDDTAAGVIWAYLGPDVDPTTSSAEDAAHFMSGSAACTSAAVDPATIENKSLAHELNRALISVANAGAPLGQRMQGGVFAGLALPEFKTWYTTNAVKIRTCALATSDLP